MFRKLLCLLGIHKYESTGERDAFFVDEISHPYELKEKHVCVCCKKEEWLNEEQMQKSSSL